MDIALPGGVLVVVDEFGDGGGGEDGRVVGVEAEAVVHLLDARVQCPLVPSEGHGEQVLVLRAVTQQKCP